MDRLDEIEAAFLKLKVSASKVAEGDKTAEERAYDEIFALNNEIGRLGRERPSTMPKMKELQAYVNMITVGIKYARIGDLREGLAITEKAIRSARKDLTTPP